MRNLEADCHFIFLRLSLVVQGVFPSFDPLKAKKHFNPSPLANSTPPPSLKIDCHQSKPSASRPAPGEALDVALSTCCVPGSGRVGLRAIWRPPAPSPWAFWVFFNASACLGRKKIRPRRKAKRAFGPARTMNLGDQ